MREVNLRDVIVWPIVSRLGYDPNKDLFGDFADALSRYINAWVRKCWPAADWPELSRIEARTPTAHLVPYDGGTTDIGKVLKVYVTDPRVSDGPFDTPFRLEETNIHVGFDHGTQVWIKFMSRPNIYTLTVWDATTTYATGDLVYDPVSGNDYTSAQDANTNHDVTDTDWWSLVPFPFVIAEPVWRGAYSDALRDEGQTAKAQAEEQAAMQELQLAITRELGVRYDTLTDQQTPTPRVLSQPAALTPTP